MFHQNKLLLFVSTLFFFGLLFSPSWGQSGTIITLSAADKTGIANFHTQIRSEVNPPAADMQGPVTWDDSIQTFWLNNPDNCVWSHTTNTYRTVDGVYYGENLSAQTNNPSNKTQYAKGWADEKAYYTYATNGCASGQQCGHYTQMVWKNSISIGCVLINCTGVTGTNPNLLTKLFAGYNGAYLFACNYKPGGNYNGQKPYTEATQTCTPLTSCPTGKNCGSVSDGCGGTISCGSGCNTGTEKCVSNVCQNCATDTSCDGRCGSHDNGCNAGSASLVTCGSTCPEDFNCLSTYCQACNVNECEAGVTCGPIDNGCGTTLDCGNPCDSQTETCVNSRCESCQTSACPSENACGTIEDNGCGVPLSCGSCFVGSRCNDATHTCENCATTTCGSFECGNFDDGCLQGNSISCGTCTSPEVCGPDYTCIDPTCSPTTDCSSVECGLIDDGCGTTLNCGTSACGSDERCIDHVCTPVCVPDECGSHECGSYPDGCGGTLSCGTCTGSSVCLSSGTCCSPLASCPTGSCAASVSNGCGGYLDCSSSCSTSQVCVDGECCSPAGAELCVPDSCAPVDDGCGGFVDCSNTCGDCKECSLGDCVDSANCGCQCGDAQECLEGGCACISGYYNSLSSGSCQPVSESTTTIGFSQIAPTGPSDWVLLPSPDSGRSELGMISAGANVLRQIRWVGSSANSNKQKTTIVAEILTNGNTAVELDLRYNPSNKYYLGLLINIQSGKGYISFVYYLGGRGTMEITNSYSLTPVTWVDGAWNTVKFSITEATTNRLVLNAQVNGVSAFQIPGTTQYYQDWQLNYSYWSTLGDAVLGTTLTSATSSSTSFRTISLATATSLYVTLARCMTVAEWKSLVASTLGIPEANVDVTNFDECTSTRNGRRQAGAASGFNFVISSTAENSASALSSRFTSLANSGKLSSGSIQVTSISEGTLPVASTVGPSLSVSSSGSAAALSTLEIVGIAVGAAVALAIAALIVAGVVVGAIVIVKKRKNNGVSSYRLEDKKEIEMEEAGMTESQRRKPHGGVDITDHDPSRHKSITGRVPSMVLGAFSKQRQGVSKV